MAGKFSLDFTAIIEKTKANIDLVIPKATIDIFSSVILKNPVGNPSLWKVAKPPKGYVGGRSRANWICTVGAPNRTTITDVDPGGSKTISAMQSIVMAAKAGNVVYLSNNMPYVKTLEYGRENGQPGSTQAPQGMVRITILEYQKYLRNAIKSIRR